VLRTMHEGSVQTTMTGFEIVLISLATRGFSLKLIKTIHVSERPYYLAFAKTGCKLAVGFGDCVEFYDASTWRRVGPRFKKIGSPICTFGTGEGFIFCNDFRVESYTIGKRATQRLLNILPSDIIGLVSPITIDGIAACEDRSVLAVTLAKCIILYDLGHSRRIKTFALGEDFGGETISTRHGFVEGYGRARIFSFSGVGEPFMLPGQADTSLNFAYDRFHDILYSGGTSGDLYSWDLRRKRLIYHAYPMDHGVSAIAFTGKHSLIAMGSRADPKLDDSSTANALVIVDGRTARVLCRAKFKTDGVMALAFSSSGEELVEADRNGTLNFFRLIH